MLRPEHFKLEHPELASSCYSSSTLYECRACESMLFGSQQYLLQHFQQVHATASLSISRESLEKDEKRGKSFKIKKILQPERFAESSPIQKDLRDQLSRRNEISAHEHHWSRESQGSEYRREDSRNDERVYTRKESQEEVRKR